MSQAAVNNPAVALRFTEKDVLYGRGAGFYSHAGNRLLRRLVNYKSSDFLDLNYGGRCRLIRSVMMAAYSQGMRFLQREATSGAWMEVPESQVLLKIKEAFREATRKTKPAQGSSALATKPAGSTPQEISNVAAMRAMTPSGINSFALPTGRNISDQTNSGLRCHDAILCNALGSPVAANVATAKQFEQVGSERTYSVTKSERSTMSIEVAHPVVNVCPVGFSRTQFCNNLTSPIPQKAEKFPSTQSPFTLDEDADVNMNNEAGTKDASLLPFVDGPLYDEPKSYSLGPSNLCIPIVPLAAPPLLGLPTSIAASSVSLDTRNNNNNEVDRNNDKKNCNICARDNVTTMTTTTTTTCEDFELSEFARCDEDLAFLTELPQLLCRAANQDC